MKLLLTLIGWYFNVLSWILPKLSGKQAFHLFAFPFKAKLQSEGQAFLDTSDKFRLEVIGDQVQFYTWGSGPEVVLLVHGWQSHSYRWKHYIEAFDKKRYTICAFDAPGHGNSENRYCTIPHYEKAMDALITHKGDIDHFIGHSIGSFAITSYLYHYGYKAKTYISLASPFAASEFVDEFISRLSLSDRSLDCLYNYFIDYTGHDLDHYSQAVFANNIKSDRILIIHDKQDEATPHQNALKLRALLKDAGHNVEMTITDGLFHRLKSKEIVDRVVKYIENEFTFIT